MRALDLVREAVAEDNGTRPHKVALQVNPYAYRDVHGHKGRAAFADEAAYNDALVARLVEGGITAIAVTDHNRIETARALIDVVVGWGVGGGGGDWFAGR